MCGLAGLLSLDGLAPQDVAALPAMGDAIFHRGPDAGDVWRDPVGVAFVHRRLAIIDVSPAGAQPMISASGRYVIAYNGEIYNFAAIRSALEEEGRAPRWRGHSDTEVALAAFEAWGICGALARFEGMFALALWSREDGKLILARDRFGEKPLYYGWQGQGVGRRLLFGSDLASLRCHPSFDGELDTAAVADLCRLLYIAEPRSIYRGISKVPAGAWVTIDRRSGEQTVDRYFDLRAFAEAARAEGFPGKPDEAVDAVERVLGDAIERQMVSDVPLGAFLSGGIDSTTVVALMQSRSSRRVRTFTIGFGDDAWDEATAARAVADHLGTEHRELRISPEDALAVIPDLPRIYSEPFADSSQIPTYLVSRMARKEVTVALSGDGGDEMFAGYNRHRFAHIRWPAISKVPRRVRAAAGSAMQMVPPSTWDAALGGWIGVARPGEKIHKAALGIASPTPDALYDALVSVGGSAEEVLSSEDGRTSRAVRDAASLDPATATWPLAERMMLEDALGYLPGDILAKVDRAAMAVSLETRVPFLDPSVARLAWQLPVDMKIRGGRTKWPLRALLDRHVPAALVDRPKMGFGVPIADWLRGPLRDWAETLVSPAALRDTGLFDPMGVGCLWRLHLSGKSNVEHRLWPVLMIQAWCVHERGGNQKS